MPFRIKIELAKGQPDWDRLKKKISTSMQGLVDLYGRWADTWWSNAMAESIVSKNLVWSGRMLRSITNIASQDHWYDAVSHGSRNKTIRVGTRLPHAEKSSIGGHVGKPAGGWYYIPYVTDHLVAHKFVWHRRRDAPSSFGGLMGAQPYGNYIRESNIYQDGRRIARLFRSDVLKPIIPKPFLTYQFMDDYLRMNTAGMGEHFIDGLAARWTRVVGFDSTVVSGSPTVSSGVGGD